MSYLLFGSSTHTGMGWVDQVPRAGNLYIGGLYALYQTQLIESAGITHVLSVINYDSQLSTKFPHLKHLHISVEDDPNEDLLKEFPRTCEYIDGGLRGDGDGKEGGVFVHCAMGKSRSAAVVVAFLMWKFGVGWEEGLRWLCEGRPVCEPNLGFKEQLGVWERMLKVQGEERRGVYEKWVKERFTGEWWEWDKRATEGKEKRGVKAQL